MIDRHPTRVSLQPGLQIVLQLRGLQMGYQSMTEQTLDHP
jgi:hypothetical protein